MVEPIPRRTFLEAALARGALAALGVAGALASCERLPPRAGRGRPSVPPPGGPVPSLSPEEKARLKAELQRELERKVYAVDEGLFRKVNRARTPGRYEGHERSHVPRINAPRTIRRLVPFSVKVEVGVEEIHEMQTFHYIDWIGLRVDGVQISLVTLTPFFTLPVVTFELMLERSATLTAQEHCNLHGTWESEPWVIEAT